MIFQIENLFIVGMEIGFVSILFVIGILIIRRVAKEIGWSTSLLKALIVHIPWLILSIFSIIMLFLPIIDNFFIDFIKIAYLFITGMIVVSMIYEKDLKSSALFTILIQVIFFVLINLYSLLLNLSLLFAVIGELENDQLSGGIIMYFISLFTTLGITGFYSYWGDKVQLIKRKRLIAITSITPSFFILSISYLNEFDTYNTSFSIFLLISLACGLIIAGLLKEIAYRKVPYREIRELVNLERGKNLLQVDNLVVHYPLLGGMLKRQIGAVKAVSGVNFEIKTGETLGLVGESGCGKTTVANAILGIVKKTSGEIYFNNEPILKEEYSSYLRRKIQIVFQDPDASLNPRMKIVDIIAEPLINLLGVTKKDDIRRYVLKLLKQVSLKREHMDRYPHEFSGGQKQRIIIARALASNPELIILDEPTSALDVSVQAQILNLLKELQKTYGYGFLFITHNLSVVNHIADRVAVMYLGKFVEVGQTDQIFNHPTHPYTQALLASRTEIDVHNRDFTFVIEGEVPSPIAPPPGCTFNPRCVSDARTNECEFELPHKIEIEENHFIWCVNPPIIKSETGSKNPNLV
jgi:oligopeptide/dipeptide ABC transporter ATP-binding protein